MTLEDEDSSTPESEPTENAELNAAVEDLLDDGGDEPDDALEMAS